MSFSVHAASAPVFVRALNNTAAIIDKALAAGLDEKTILEARLAPDMHPFPRQIQMASDAAKGAAARLAGVEVPSMPDTETTLAELKERIARTVAFIESLDPAAFNGAENREIVLKFPQGEMKFTGRDFLTGFALPNFFFHVTIAYALLRANGAPIGKMDFLAGAG